MIRTARPPSLFVPEARRAILLFEESFVKVHRINLNRTLSLLWPDRYPLRRRSSMAMSAANGQEITEHVKVAHATGIGRHQRRLPEADAMYSKLRILHWWVHIALCLQYSRTIVRRILDGPQIFVGKSKGRAGQRDLS